jgi:hypothetical protein
MLRVVALALLLAGPALAEDRIATWCGGGVTGGGGGREITADGNIKSFRRTLAAGSASETPLGRDEAAYRRWRAALDEAGFATLRYRQPGNMSCSLVLHGAGGRHDVTWAGNTPPPALPQAVRAVFEELSRWTP